MYDWKLRWPFFLPNNTVRKGQILSVAKPRSSVEYYAMSFVWSLKPIFIYFTAFFGIDLDRSKPKSSWSSYFSTSLPFLWLVIFNIPLNVFYLILYWEQIPAEVSALSLNINIVILAPPIIAILFHISLTISYFGKWELVCIKFQQLQEVIGNVKPFYRQIRRHTIHGMMLVIVVNICSIFGLFIMVWLRCFGV